MLYPVFRTLLVTVALVTALTSAASAQVGIGAGVAALGADVRRANDDLQRLADGGDVTYADISGGMGFYGIFRIKYSYGGIWRFAGDVAYTYFPESNIRLVETDQQGDTVSGVFDIGASLITGSFGLDVTLPVEYFRPYVSGQATYTIFNRTFAKVSGSDQLDRTEIQNKWAGSNEWGLAIGAGMEFAAGDVMAIDLGARFNIANLFSRTEDEPTNSYLQIGATLFFGDLLKDKKEKDEEEDERLRR